MLSRRTGWDLSANALAARVEEARAGGRIRLDLSESNPSRVGLGWPPDEIAAVLADPRAAIHEPTPWGMPEAREAISTYLASRRAAAAPERILLTSSTSEGYSLLMKLLCDPGEEWLVPAPAYPLLDMLAGLEGVGLVRYPLRHDGEWRVDLRALEEGIGPRARAVLVVSPSNPTGALLSREELSALERLCAARGLALVGDEVFADTALSPTSSVLEASSCLAFHLAGLSKTCGLPQLKAAWIAAAGPEPLVAPALARLEVAADAYLSVSAPAQLAVAPLLARRERFLSPLRERLATNRATLGRVAAGRGAPFGELRTGGGWSAVLRIGETVDEEALCLVLLDEGVLVQPGFFYDFERPGHLVVSLLPEPGTFEEGILAVDARLRRGG